MKSFLKCLCVILSLFIGSCENDKPEPIVEECIEMSIVGNWYGTRSYYNPVGGTKYQNLTLRFASDSTGEIEYDGPTSLACGKFAYTQSGNIITCKGVWASTNSDVVDLNFELNLKLEGNRLLPQNRFSEFILTRDSSVITDGDGNEIIDNKDLLTRVWVSTDGLNVIEFYAYDYDEYELDSPHSNSYRAASSGKYSYDYTRSILTIDGTQWSVKVLSKTELKIERNGTVKSYKGGSKKDIPTSLSLKEYLTKHIFWHWQGNVSNVSIDFAFYSNGVVSYSEYYKGSTLFAQGTYSISGSRITCNYTTVTDSYDRTSGTFTGYTDTWTFGKSCTRTYSAETAGNFDVVLTSPSGRTMYLSPNS